MIKKLSDKGVIEYQKYQGVKITDSGRKIALAIVRKHRLWEVFLSQKLKFAWDEVHDLAEELEHIGSEKLINRLDEFLGFPEYDPHGDPIPDKEGNISAKPKIVLSELELRTPATIIAVKNSTPTYLQYLDKMGVQIGGSIQVTDRLDFDNSVEVSLNQSRGFFMSHEAAKNILVRPLDK
jgi:DtxR family Mn-dependent transcriptional regulator